MNVIVSACLLGLKCRYDGKEVSNLEVLKIKDNYSLIPLCPEQLGGLATPRPPAEIKNGKVINKLAYDVTEEYKKGAEEALKLAKIFDCKYAILKDRSPSCGCGQIYDGTFSGKLVPGNGITTELFLQNGIKVLGESEFSDFKKVKIQYEY